MAKNLKDFGNKVATAAGWATVPAIVTAQALGAGTNVAANLGAAGLAAGIGAGAAVVGQRRQVVRNRKAHAMDAFNSARK
jgi:hypothetical protein